MIILTQASDAGMRIFLALFIAIGLFALAAWGTHWIWYFRSFGMRGNLVLNARYFLGVIGLVVPIVGIIHGIAIWVARVRGSEMIRGRHSTICRSSNKRRTCAAACCFLV